MSLSCPKRRRKKKQNRGGAVWRGGAKLRHFLAPEALLLNLTMLLHRHHHHHTNAPANTTEIESLVLLEQLDGCTNSMRSNADFLEHVMGSIQPQTSYTEDSQSRSFSNNCNGFTLKRVYSQLLHFSGLIVENFIIFLFVQVAENRKGLLHISNRIQTKSPIDLF